MKLLIIENEVINLKGIFKQFEKIIGSDCFGEENMFIFQDDKSGKLNIVQWSELKSLKDCEFNNHKESVKESLLQFIDENSAEPIFVVIDLVLNTKARSDYPTSEYKKNKEYSVALYEELIRLRYIEKRKNVYGMMYSSSETGDVTISEVLKYELSKYEKKIMVYSYIENIPFFTRTATNGDIVDDAEDEPINFESETIKWIKALGRGELN